MTKRTAVLDAGESWISRAAMLGLSLVLSLMLAFAAFDYVVPKVPDGVQGNTRRVGWYLRSSQWRADVQTLAAAVKFIADCDPDAPVQRGSPAK